MCHGCGSKCRRELRSLAELAMRCRRSRWRAGSCPRIRCSGRAGYWRRVARHKVACASAATLISVEAGCFRRAMLAPSDRPAREAGLRGRRGRCGEYLQCRDKRLRGRRHERRSRKNGGGLRCRRRACVTLGSLQGTRRAGQDLRLLHETGDKDADTLTSWHVIGDVALCAGGNTFTPASGESGSNGFWTKVVGKAGGDWQILNLTYTIAAPQ